MLLLPFIGSELALDRFLWCRTVADEFGGKLGIGPIGDHIGKGFIHCLHKVGLLLFKGETLLI